MNNTVGMLVAVSVGAFLVGACAVCVLVMRRAMEPLMLVLGGMAFLISSWGLISLADVSLASGAIVFSVVFSIACAAGGYALGSALLETLLRPSSPLPPLDATSLPAEAPGPLVLLTACIEAEEYSPGSAAREMRRLIDDGVLSLTLGVTPLMFAAAKARYRAVGGKSPALHELTQRAEALERALPDDVTAVRVATCEGPTSLPLMVVSALKDGFRRIVVAELAVAESPTLDGCKLAVDALRLDDLGVGIAYTDPMWSLEPIAVAVVREIAKHTSEPETTGVVLVMHGLPEERSARFPLTSEQETAFASRVQMLLAETGIAGNNVRLARADWEQPDVPTSVRHLAALGCSRVLVVPSVFPLDCITTQLELPMLVRQARVDDIPVIVLPPWRDEDVVVEELAKQVRKALADLSAEAAPA